MKCLFEKTKLEKIPHTDSLNVGMDHHSRCLEHKDAGLHMGCTGRRWAQPGRGHPHPPLLGLLPDRTQFHCLLASRQPFSTFLSWPEVRACAFWRSLCDLLLLRGWSPGGTWCRCCRKPFWFWRRRVKASTAWGQSWAPGNSRSQGFPLGSCLEVLPGTEEQMWNFLPASVI